MAVTTPDWVKDAVFYQIFPDRFARSTRVAKPNHLQPWGAPPTFHAFQGGDLLGIAEKLDYLTDLGINAIYLNPIFKSAANHRYHTCDYYEIDPILGGNEAFDTLIEAAHKRGVRVVLDGVFNHVGRGFFQFNHLMECGQESPYIDWFHVYGWPLNAYDHAQPNYAAWWGNPALPKLNTGTEAVREHLLGVAEFWLQRGADGWRLDVPNEIDDDAFWQAFRRRCKAVNPDAYLVGELWHDAQRWLQGDQFDGQMNYLFTRAAYGFIGGERLDQTDTHRTGLGHMPALSAGDFARELDRIYNHLYHPEIVLAQLVSLGTHDTPRLFTVARGDKRTIALLMLAQFTCPGAPCVYYGDEIGLPGRHDPDCRRAFPWDHPETWHRDLQRLVTDLARLRHEMPALRRGSFTVRHAADDVILYQRHHGDEIAQVAINAADQQRTLTLPQDVPSLRTVLSTAAAQPQPGKQTTLPPRSGFVWAGTVP